MYEALNKAIGNIKAQMTDFERVADEAEQTEEVIPADPDVRNYTYTFYEGKLYYRENSEMVRKEVSQTAEERIRSLDEIRQITRELIDIQMDGCSEEELSDKQRLLNVKYDAFIKQYGAITSKANRIAFRDDSDYPLLCSLEEVNEDGEVKKADMFYKQTIKAKTVIDRVETAVEALNVSVNEFGYVNLAYILSIYEPDITNAKEELAEKSGKTADEITFSDEALAELRRAVLMEELDGKTLTNEEVIRELLELLKKNAMKEQANDVFEICSYVDGLEKKVDSMTEELTIMQNQITPCTSFTWTDNTTSLGITLDTSSINKAVVSKNDSITYNQPAVNTITTSNKYNKDNTSTRSGTSQNTQSISNFNYITVLFRGQDHLTLADWKNGGAISYLTSLAYDSAYNFKSANTPQGTRKSGTEYNETFATRFINRSPDMSTTYKATVGSAGICSTTSSSYRFDTSTALTINGIVVNDPVGFIFLHIFRTTDTYKIQS